MSQIGCLVSGGHQFRLHRFQPKHRLPDALQHARQFLFLQCRMGFAVRQLGRGLAPHFRDKLVHALPARMPAQLLAQPVDLGPRGVAPLQVREHRVEFRGRRHSCSPREISQRLLGFGLALLHSRQLRLGLLALLGQRLVPPVRLAGLFQRGPQRRLERLGIHARNPESGGHGCDFAFIPLHVVTGLCGLRGSRFPVLESAQQFPALAQQHHPRLWGSALGQADRHALFSPILGRTGDRRLQALAGLGRLGRLGPELVQLLRERLALSCRLFALLHEGACRGEQHGEFLLRGTAERGGEPLGRLSHLGRLLLHGFPGFDELRMAVAEAAPLLAPCLHFLGRTGSEAARLPLGRPCGVAYFHRRPEFRQLRARLVRHFSRLGGLETFFFRLGHCFSFQPQPIRDRVGLVDRARKRLLQGRARLQFLLGAFALPFSQHQLPATIPRAPGFGECRLSRQFALSLEAGQFGFEAPDPLLRFALGLLLRINIARNLLNRRLVPADRGNAGHGQPHRLLEIGRGARERTMVRRRRSGMPLQLGLARRERLGRVGRFGGHRQGFADGLEILLRQGRQFPLLFRDLSRQRFRSAEDLRLLKLGGLQRLGRLFAGQLRRTAQPVLPQLGQRPVQPELTHAHRERRLQTGQLFPQRGQTSFAFAVDIEAPMQPLQRARLRQHRTVHDARIQLRAKPTELFRQSLPIALRLLRGSTFRAHAHNKVAGDLGQRREQGEFFRLLGQFAHDGQRRLAALDPGELAFQFGEHVLQPPPFLRRLGQRLLVFLPFLDADHRVATLLDQLLVAVHGRSQRDIRRRPPLEDPIGLRLQRIQHLLHRRASHAGREERLPHSAFAPQKLLRPVSELPCA
ncbi:MAG: hypothetical protein BWX86_02192 [Verrucomicrobia bacterium ADurb.Bin122]|nr:MAG: hypothetical protein BWX86_02192 [Verrucomicrobia bacterium ADurb.Bin122]